MVNDEHFTGDNGDAIIRKLEDLHTWATCEASWIHRDRFLDRRWWEMIDAIEVVKMRLVSYKIEKGQKHG